MKSLLPVFVIFTLPILVQAQVKPLVRLMPLSFEGQHTEETQSIEDLIRSYIEDLGEINPENPEYIFSGRIDSKEDYRVLSLEVLKRNSGETYLYAYTFKSFSELALKTRSLVSSVFSSGMDPLRNSPEASGFLPAAEALSVDALTGTWRSARRDPPGLGVPSVWLEMVRLERNGTGMALFSSGEVMRLGFRIESNTLRITQNSPNTERYYHPLPRNIARQLAEKAEPMRWELSLFEQGTILRGTVFFTGVSHNGETITEFNPLKGETEWTRSGR
jgi:hypothetical protein